MSAENTNAGGGETTRVPPKGSEERAFWLEAATFHGFEETCGGEEIPEYDPPAYFATEAEVLALMAACRDQGRRDAALSAQSTGSAGVAAEPVAWAYEELKTYAFDTWEHALSYDKPEAASYHRNIRPLYEHPPVAAEPPVFVRRMAAAAQALQDHPVEGLIKGDLYLAVKNAGQGTGWRYVCSGVTFSDLEAALAAAPTPPAGGGETERLFRQSLADHPVITETLRAVEPSPASPAGDLISLSAGATPGEWHFRCAKPGHAWIADAPEGQSHSKIVLGKEAFYGGDADYAFVARLVSDYRSGRLVEAAPAAPRKMPSEEEIGRLAALMDDADHGYSIKLTSLTEGVSTYSLDLCDGSPILTFPDSEDAREYANKHRSRAKAKAAFDFVSALLTPADRGETQAVGDGN